jgi:hypothetical protein
MSIEILGMDMSNCLENSDGQHPRSDRTCSKCHMGPCAEKASLKSGHIKLDAEGFHGSYTNGEGQRIQMTSEEAAALWAHAEAQRRKRAAEMPDEQSAIQAMWHAYQRLKELGWYDAVYCPKDGSTFKVIEVGSTGIFDCHYQGDWPAGSWLLHENGDLWPSRPTLYKLTPEAQAAHDARMKAAGKLYRAETQGSDK